MASDDEHEPKPSEDSPRTARQGTSADTVAFADFEVAWLDWSSGIQPVDESSMALLKAAFEAGWEAGKRT